MVEQKIEPEVLSANLKRNLAPGEGEAYAEFNEELAEMREESMLEVALVGFLSEGESRSCTDL